MVGKIPYEQALWSDRAKNYWCGQISTKTSTNGTRSVDSNDLTGKFVLGEVKIDKQQSTKEMAIFR